MTRWLGIAFVWAVGVRNLVLSRSLITMTGLDAEMNLVARWAVEMGGTSALVIVKVSGLACFTLAVIYVRGKRRETDERLIVAGVAVSMALTFWWDPLIW